MKKVFNVILVLTFLLSSKIFAAHLNFTASLTGLQEVPAVSTSASGTGAFTLTNSGGLNFIITVNGLSGYITGAHFHLGSLKQNGQIVKDVSSFTGNTASGSWKSTDAQPLNDSLIAALMTGKIYINVHTSANPGGEIRGQVLITSGTTLIARLNGLNEVPSITTNASGIGSVTLASVGGVGLGYNLSVNGLSGPITGAHFHVGEIGVSGPVVFDITNSFNGSNASGVWRTTGANALPDSLITALLTGRLYLNVHTVANPSGEIRGQLYLNAGIGMEAILDGVSNVPPVTTPAKATASLTLTDYGLVFDITMQGLSTPLNNAHFHNGDSTVNGPIVFDFRNLISNNTAKGVWRSTSSGGSLTPASLKELLDGRIYINLHTVTNPGGEIRSQIKLKNGSGITAKMTGLQEVPSVITTASGTASMLANPTSVIYNITVNGLSGPITGAHFHIGSIKENGPIVKDITSTFLGNTAAGVWAATDPQPFNDSLRAALVAGRIYVNVHTAANPGGEIRGQVLLSAGGGLISVLEGMQEVPSVTTTAKGTTSYTLTRGGLGFNVALNGLSGPITGAHFHL